MKIIFDFDGTIHNTEIVYKKALTKSLNEFGLDINDFAYKSFIGMSPKDVWDLILQNNEDKRPYIKKNGDRIIEIMIKEGRLFDGAYCTLSYLSEKYDLYILSKCRNAYMDAAREKFNLDRYFKKYFLGEKYDYLDKYKILRKEINGAYIVVGDRKEDIDAGLNNGQKSIFASYGYGDISEGEGADLRIYSIIDLINIL